MNKCKRGGQLNPVTGGYRRKNSGWRFRTTMRSEESISEGGQPKWGAQVDPKVCVRSVRARTVISIYVTSGSRSATTTATTTTTTKTPKTSSSSFNPSSALIRTFGMENVRARVREIVHTCMRKRTRHDPARTRVCVARCFGWMWPLFLDETTPCTSSGRCR